MLNMRATRVVNQRHIRPRELRQAADFAAVVHAQFDDRVAVRIPQFQQGQRHADFVIEVAARGEHPISATRSLAQNRRQHFFHGGFAAAASQRHQRAAKTAAPRKRQPRQRLPRIFNRDERHACRRERCALRIRHHRHCTGGLRGSDVLVRIKMLAAQGNKQFTRLDVATVRAHRSKHHISAMMRDAQRRRRF